jgi:hypothetical protein
MIRDFKLALELHEYAIFYHWNYSPPVKNIGGCSGRIYPDGALHGKSFDCLKTLGNGVHDVQIDEKLRTPNGTKPEFADDRTPFEVFRFARLTDK